MDFNLFLIDRWFHVIAGITWIGILYYFNFIQAPALGAAAADKEGPGGAGITKYVAPLALVWFRWSALVTWITGAVMLHLKGWLLGAFALGFAGASGIQVVTIGVGAWLGTFMLFNVWVIIWPNQKKVLGMVSATDDEKAKAKRTAFLASRANTMMSIPMLLCMVGSVHGLAF